MFLFFFMLVGAICAALFFMNLTSLKTPPDVSYTINTTQLKNNKITPVSLPLSLPHEIGFANGQFYFPISIIMDKMDFVLVGDKSELSFVRAKSNEYIKFIADTNTVYINDEKLYSPGPSFLDADNIIYAPLEFLDNTFDNLKFSFDEKNGYKITVDVEDIAESCFKIQKAKKLDAAQESEAPYFTADPIKFTADLSEYEKYFNSPADKQDEYLVLINQFNPLDPQNYVPPDLTDVNDTRKDGRATQQLRLYTAKALEAFLIEARANGIENVTVTSAYRSYGRQSELFNDEVAKMRPVHGDNAELVAAMSVARPGQSEHQSGLCLDMHTYGTGAAQEFGDTAEGKWLAQNAYKFGFILRYPKNKTEITGIKYEPWHFRYVGRFHATIMHEKDLCFEEYWELYLKR